MVRRRRKKKKKKDVIEQKRNKVGEWEEGRLDRRILRGPSR